MADRLPYALRVFQTLKRFNTIRPRRMPQILPGATNVESSRLRALSIQHIYDDLGVLVFAGASTIQVNKIGDMIQEIVKLGGPGRITDGARGVNAKIHVVRIPGDDIRTQTGFKKEEGLLTSGARMKVAKMAVWEWLQQAWEGVYPKYGNFGDVVFVDKNVSIGSIFPPFGISHETVDGVRKLPIDAIFVPRAAGIHMNILVNLYAAVTGKYLGSVTFSTYAHLPKSSDPGVMKGLASTFLPELADTITDTGFMRPMGEDVIPRLTNELWQLEREIWADRFPQVQEEEQTEKQARKKEKREFLRERQIVRDELKAIQEEMAKQKRWADVQKEMEQERLEALRVQQRIEADLRQMKLERQRLRAERREDQKKRDERIRELRERQAEAKRKLVEQRHERLLHHVHWYS